MSRHRGGGNAMITLAKGVSKNNEIIFQGYPVWLYGITLNVSTQFSSPQLLKGISWSPIRLLETIGFSIMWPTQGKYNTVTDNNAQLQDQRFEFAGFKAMNQFHNSLRFHQQLATTIGSAPPFMTLLFNNESPSLYANPNPLVNNNIAHKQDDTSLTLQPIRRDGFIKAVSKEYDRFKNVYYNNYTMEILVPVTQKSASIAYSSRNTHVVPDAADVLRHGPNWVRQTSQLTDGIAVGQIGN